MTSLVSMSFLKKPGRDKGENLELAADGDGRQEEPETTIVRRCVTCSVDVYTVPQGKVWHKNPECPGLKVAKTTVEGRRPCKKCVGRS